MLKLKVPWVCHQTLSVYTDSSIVTPGKKTVFDANKKAALCMLHTGIGYTTLTKFLPTVNIPSLHHSTFKRPERNVGKVVEEVAKDLCKLAIQEVKDKRNGGHVRENQSCEMAASFDNANPTQQHLSGSESTCFRMALTVAESNIGHSLVSKENEKWFLSPGKHMGTTTETFDKISNKQYINCGI